MQIVVVIYLFDQSLISALLGLVQPFLRPMNIDCFYNKTFSFKLYTTWNYISTVRHVNYWTLFKLSVLISHTFRNKYSCSQHVLGIYMETLDGKLYLLTNKMTKQFVENNLWRVFIGIENFFFFPNIFSKIHPVELYQVTFIQFKICDVQTRMFFEVWHVQSLQVQFLLIGFSDYTIKHWTWDTWTEKIQLTL